ncbi:hypothetical protein IIA_01399 [Bacillus cereus VD014]|uniref:Uncharacterized protein n=1 Tax=Bacillus cereus (strain VD014) TaxID=1053223 RepID=A0A9W5K9V6_BACC8|nr:hypothetical protein IIA_01399 [Bacillus cereus VD014]
MVLVKVTFVAGVFPVFVIVVVYVSVSPTEITDLSTVFVVVNIALLMVVETVFDIVVCNTEGWLGSTTCSNCTELKLEIGFILGIFVTRTLRVITVVPLGFIFPICIPFPGFPICCVPESFVKVPEINVVPSGQISVKIIFCEVTFPGLLNVIV